MPNTFTDLKRPSRALLKRSPPPPADPVPVAKPEKTPEELAATPQPKRKDVFRPKPAKPVKDDFLAKLRLHRKWYGW